MFNFNAEQIMREHQNGVDIIPQVEAAVDAVCKKGYKNIFYIGIGGTILYANQMAIIAKQEGSMIPLYVENAADFCIMGNPHFGNDSVVTKDYSLDGISEEFRGILSPIIMRCSFQRVSTHLEHKRRHPLEIRRYYRRLKY